MAHAQPAEISTIGRIRTLAIDIGGTGLKASVIDETGRLLTDRVRVNTPVGSPPREIVEALARLVSALGSFDRVSVGFPGVVRNGRVLTAPNLDNKGWKDFDLAGALGRSLGKPVLVAVVDLGSTAVRILLARLTPAARFQIVAQERVPTRLGGGAPGTLPRAAIEATLRAVRRFFRRHAEPGAGPRIVAVATSAVRDARNRERLLAPLRYEEGIEVQVLSARDEARLGVDAALESLPVRNAVVADLGGSSLQLSRVRHR